MYTKGKKTLFTKRFNTLLRACLFLKQVFVTFAVLWAVFLWSSPGLAANLVQNGDFEAGNDFWSGGVIDTANPHNGTASLRIEDSDSNGRASEMTTEYIPIAKNSAYHLEVWIRGDRDKQNAEVTLLQYDGNNNFLSGKNIWFRPVYVSTQWTPFERTIRNFDPDAVYVRVMLRPVNWSEPESEIGTAWFDDVLFEETATGEGVQGSLIVDTNNLAIWQSPVEQKIRPGMLLSPDAPVANCVEISAAGDEYEPFQLVLSSKGPNESLIAVELPELAGPGGAVLPANIYTVREVAYIEVTRPTDYGSFTGRMPDPLPQLQLPLNLADATQLSQQQPVWFTVKVPRGASAGVYTGVLRLHFAIGGWVSVPLRLRVWDFDMPLETHFRTAYGLSPHALNRMDLYHNLGGDPGNRRDLYNLYLENFAQHRISPGSSGSGVPIFGDDGWSILYRDPNGEFLNDYKWNGGIIGSDPDDPTGTNKVMEVVDNRDDQNIRAHTPNVLPVQSGTDYIFSARVKTDTPQDYLIALNQYDSNGKWISGGNIDLIRIGDGTWQQLPVLIPASKFTSETAMVGFSLYPVYDRNIPWEDSDVLTGRAWFDALELTPATGTGMTFSESFEPPPFSPQDIQVEIDFTDFDKAADYALDTLGFNAFRLSLPGFASGFQKQFTKGRLLNFEWLSDDYKALFHKTMKPIIDHLDNHGWLDRAYIYEFDEMKEYHYQKVVDAFDFLHQVDDRLKRMLVINESVDTILDNAVDIWVPLLDIYDPEWAEERRQLPYDDETWWYICTGPKLPYPNNFIDAPGITHRIRFWMAWRLGVEGELLWETVFWTSSAAPSYPAPQDPWTDPMSYGLTQEGNLTYWGNGDGRLLYPPRDWTNGQIHMEGPTPSLRWELIREGLEDYEYFWMLNQETEKLKAQGHQYGLIEQANQLLEIPASIMTSVTDYTDDPEQLSSRRTQIAETLEAIFNIGDINRDDCIDRADLVNILGHIRGAKPYDPLYDLNGDGAVNIADGRMLVTLFSEPRGQACP